MKKLYCCKCKEYKNNWQYANPYNSTKFCYDCGVALEEKVVENPEPELAENPYSFIFEGLRNAVNKMFADE